MQELTSRILLGIAFALNSPDRNLHEPRPAVRKHEINPIT